MIREAWYLDQPTVAKKAKATADIPVLDRYSF